ncbi:MULTISPECIES: hypothetical protein [Mycobacteriaceae]|uniref:Uncharacterized protein n=2 Tax=Mycolicibacterium TaxID=1866885 RepID=A0ABR5FMP1_9MYCO|nr:MULTISPECIES: hypothetical protein [Mycolicibacterium]OLT97678.1 hypothetical protein BKG60_04720 [Mycobacterium syngnathidarum]KLI09395.1 hypothetical protein AA982_05055 [Mycolicibacterium senegalense]KLO47788.1 hypothetical protein ABW05_32080 [Mycolicibacterium senegalense]MBP2451764.1 hypothetical protein [Mycolicibacterium lutetiense]OMB90217.1 hypothetical protein A5741_12665 [Mycolicibacterium conceptionense]
MTHPAHSGTAYEVLAHRRVSPIGSPQRHFSVTPAIVAVDGRSHRNIALIPDAETFYAFVSSARGVITDWTNLLGGEAGPVGSVEDALSRLGYLLTIPSRRDSVA